MAKSEIVVDGVKYRKVDEEKSKYREVRRGAKAGERIRIVDARETFGAYENGDEFIVDGVSRFESGVYVEEVETPGNDSGYIIDREYVVLEPNRLTVGDYVKVVNTSFTHNFELGEVGKITRVDKDDIPYRVESVCGERVYWLTEAEVELATKEDFERAVDEYKRKQFKKGDKVRLVSGGGEFPLIGFADGNLYEVMDNDYHHDLGVHGKKIRIKSYGRREGYARPDQLERMTEEGYNEYVRERREEEERRKWARIGREVGEIKRDDLVRVVDGLGGEYAGTIGTAVFNGTTNKMSIYGGKSCLYEGKVELICPVEKRFDIDKE